MIWAVTSQPTPPRTAAANSDGHDHRRRPRQPELAEPVDQRAEQERQERRQGHRDEDRLGPVEGPDDRPRRPPSRSASGSHAASPLRPMPCSPRDSLVRTPSYPPRRPGLRTHEGRSFVVSNRGAKTFGAGLAWSFCHPGQIGGGSSALGDERSAPVAAYRSARARRPAAGRYWEDSRWRTRVRGRSGWGRCPTGRRPRSGSGRRTRRASPSSAPSTAGTAAGPRWSPRGTAAGMPRSPAPAPATSTATCWRRRTASSRGSTPTPARSPTRRATA